MQHDPDLYDESITAPYGRHNQSSADLRLAIREYRQKGTPQ